MGVKPLERILLAENVEVAAWRPPSVDGASMHRRSRPTLAEMESVERAAWDEAYEKGHAAGVQAGEATMKKKLAELDQRVAQINALLNSLVNPIAQADEEVEKQLVELAFAVSKHLLRRELKLDPSQVIAVVRETVGLLPVSQRDVRVHLHPQDAALIRERLAEPQNEQAWRIVEDPMMTRGGCRVSTDTAQIDARIESRLAAAFSHLLGDERAPARENS